MGHGASECAAATGEASQGARKERSSTDAIGRRIATIIYANLWEYGAHGPVPFLPTSRYSSIVSLRRMAGLLMSGFLLHLNLQAADATCAHHSVRGVRESATSHSARHAYHAGSARDAINTETPCEIPAQPNCCQALASCSMVALASGARSTALPNTPGAISQMVSEIPTSPVASPDPPPPKA